MPFLFAGVFLHANLYLNCTLLIPVFTDIAAQIPWLVGSGLAMGADLLLIGSAAVWGRKWRNSPRGKLVEGDKHGDGKDPEIRVREHKVDEAKYALTRAEEDLDEYKYHEKVRSCFLFFFTPFFLLCLFRFSL